MPKVRYLVRLVQLWERVPPFFAAMFSSRGLGSRDGRLLVLGKFRRMLLSLSPSFSRYLQKRYGLQGGCTGCGASCNLLNRCPQWDEKTHLCTVYEDRPNICRLFPITPSDIVERNIAMKETRCGFHFEKGANKTASSVTPKPK